MCCTCNQDTTNLLHLNIKMANPHKKLIPTVYIFHHFNIIIECNKVLPLSGNESSTSFVDFNSLEYKGLYKTHLGEGLYKTHLGITFLDDLFFVNI